MDRVVRAALMVGIILVTNSEVVYANNQVVSVMIDNAPYVEVGALKDVLDVTYSDEKVTIGDSVHKITVYTSNLSMCECTCGYDMFISPMVYKDGKYMISLRDLKSIFGYTDEDLKDLSDNKRKLFADQKGIFEDTGDFKEVAEHFICDTNIGMNGAVLVEGRIKYVIGECEEYLKDTDNIEKKINNKGLLALSEMQEDFTHYAIEVYNNFNEYTNEELEEITVQRDKYLKDMEDYLQKLESGFNTKHY